MSGEYRQYLFPHDHPRLAEVRGMERYAYREHARTSGTFTGGLVEGWTPLYGNEFRGVTEDGTLREGLYSLEPARPGEEAPVGAMVAAAEDLLSVLDAEGRQRISFDVDAVEWQTWANPEFMQFDSGLRLDLQPEVVRERALALMRASLSPEGFEIAHAMMLINGFLGEVVDLGTILNEYSYNIALYGIPDLRAPWGWQLYGHHCAVNCLVVAGRMVVSPVFLGAEPDEIDAGPQPPVSRRVACSWRSAAQSPAPTPNCMRSRPTTTFPEKPACARRRHSPSLTASTSPGTRWLSTR